MHPICDEDIQTAKHEAARASAMLGVPIDEAHSIAYLGLVKAAHLFKPNKNVPFGAYARSRIRFEFMDDYRRETKDRKRKVTPAPFFVELEEDNIEKAWTETRIEERLHCKLFIQRTAKGIPCPKLRELFRRVCSGKSVMECWNGTGYSSYAWALHNWRKLTAKMERDINRLPMRKRA